MLTRKDLMLADVDTIVIEVASVCNLKCPTCRVTQSKQPKKFMEFSKFIQIAHKLPLKLARVVNISSSESLLHPDTFRIIDTIKSINPKLYVSIITNGMLLDEEKQRELLKRGINLICVSIDGARKETTEKIRPGSNFETVTRHAKQFINKGGMVRTIYVVRDNNINDLLDFVDLASDIGIHLIKCTGLISYTPEDAKHALYSWEGLHEVDTIFKKAETKAKSKGILLTYRDTKLEHGYCCLSKTMYVGINGEISPCVYLTEPTPLTLLDKTRITEPIFWGNVLEKPIQDIWLSPESLTFRQGIMNGTNCNLCGMKYTAVCGFKFALTCKE